MLTFNGANVSLCLHYNYWAKLIVWSAYYTWPICQFAFAQTLNWTGIGRQIKNSSQ